MKREAKFPLLNMKKTLQILLIFALFAGANAYAQKNTFGVKIGGNLSNLGGKDVSIDVISSKVGFVIGGTVDFEINNHLYLLYGLDLTQKGYKMEDGDGTRTMRPLFLQLPVHLGYKLKFDVMNIVFRIGPYLAYGIGGKSHSDVKSLDGVKYFDRDTNGADRFDLGLGIGFGAEFGKFGVNLGYDWGFVKVYEGLADYNRCASLSVGYRFLK